VRIRIRRVGGFTGNVALTAELDTTQLPSGDATRLQAAVDGLPWGASAAAPPHPDAFRYEIDLPDQPERGLAVLQEPELGGALAPLGEHLTTHGVVGPSRRPAT
jgi:hypothetical protein